MSIVCLFGRLGLLHSDVLVWLESTATAAMASGRSHMRVLPLGTLCRTTSAPWLILSSSDKKHSYRRVTARCILSVVILPIATQQCRNYLYDKSWPNWWYEVRGLVGDNVSWTMCTQPWRDRVGSHVSYVINKTTTVELCISPVYRRLAVAKFSKSTM